MSHTPHELAEEFPEYVARMHALKSESVYFVKLADAYHAVNRATHRAETRVEPMDDAVEESLRKQRLRLKDEIHALPVG
jgi:uncharacterized protein